MRQIKFRAQEIASNKWLYGDLRHHKDDVCIFEQGGMKGEQVKRDTIGQFTGLTDEFDREVYEGDIIMLDGSPEMGARVVVFYEESFNIATRKEYDYLLQGAHPYLNDYAHMDCLNTWSNSGLVRVVGNIYDNPELLEG
jgi:uncharacterized phage protein (TIGR01671 family)